MNTLKNLARGGSMSNRKKATVTLVLAVLYVVTTLVKHYASLDAFQVNSLVCSVAFPVLLWFRGRGAVGEAADAYLHGLYVCSLMLVVVATAIAPFGR